MAYAIGVTVLFFQYFKNILLLSKFHGFWWELYSFGIIIPLYIWSNVLFYFSLVAFLFLFCFESVGHDVCRHGFLWTILFGVCCANGFYLSSYLGSFSPYLFKYFFCTTFFLFSFYISDDTNVFGIILQVLEALLIFFFQSFFPLSLVQIE